ncbi:MAG: hypothetical protein K2O64_02370, partial [Lactobacillus sp.]|nr:hypothetical protein [Lactobacillus sp.]
TTNPDNPTGVTPNEPVPTIPGYTPEIPNVTPTNPGTDTKVIYTPNTPDIPVSPTVTTINAKQTIEFVDENGQEIHPSNVQTHTFTLTDDVSNESSYTFGTITVPVIKGYVADVETVGGKTVTPQDPDAKVVVVYHKIGKIIPVTSDGQQISGAPTPQYQNDPNDPTKVEPNEDVPTISGYTPNETTVTPIDPTKDTQVIYTKNTTPNEPDNSEPDDNEPDEDDDNTPEPTKPHKNHPKNNSSRAPKPTYSNNIGPHSQIGNWNNNTSPHATIVNGWTNNIGPHGETVNANGQIIGPNGQVIGYVDKNGNPHYYSENGKSVLAHATNANRKLPQTGESNQDIADAVLAGVAVSIS